jgi:hypothetical protein
MIYRALIVAVIFSFLGSATTIFAADVKDAAEELFVQKVYDFPGVDKAKIYDRSRIWMAKEFKSSKQAIEFESKESGIIMGNGKVPYKTGFGARLMGDIQIYFVMKEEIKDNKIRVTFEKLCISNVFDKEKEPSAFTEKKELPAITPQLLALSDKLAEHITKSKDGEGW